MLSQSLDVQNKRHPARALIEQCLGKYSLECVVEEDVSATAVMRQPGLIAFLSTLLRDGRVLAQGRGSAILNKANRYLDRAVRSAFNSSISDAAIRATKVLDTFIANPIDEQALEEAYQARDVGSPPPMITDKQRSYLTELIHINISEERERGRMMSDMDSLTREQASEAIANFVR